MLVWVTGRVDEQLRPKVEYLVAENRILRNQVPGRPRLTDGQCATLAAIGAKLGREALEAVASIDTHETILRWHRALVARKFDGTEAAKREASSGGRRLRVPSWNSSCRWHARTRPMATAGSSVAWRAWATP